MAFEKSQFGDGTTNTTSNVSNHYGPRSTGGESGTVGTKGAYKEAVVNFDATGPIYDVVTIPTGATVMEVDASQATGAVVKATVGAIDISAAVGTQITYVDITLGGALVVTGPTAGTVIVRYSKLA